MSERKSVVKKKAVKKSAIKAAGLKQAAFTQIEKKKANNTIPSSPEKAGLSSAIQKKNGKNTALQLNNPKKIVAVKKKTGAVSKKPSKTVKQIVKPLTTENVVKPAKEKKIVLNGEPKEVIEKVASLKKPRKSSKKQKTRIPLPPPVEVSSYPKSKVKEILVSQPQPVENEKNPYYELAKKHHVNINFRQFIRVQGISAQDFRTQRVDILEHGAVILTSKLAVDHYFRICSEMRITVPESMKYFCINEQTAYYLQKYIQYRKRKIFFGHGTITDLVDVIKKNRSEKFLLPASDAQKEQIVDFLEEVKISFTRAIIYQTVAADLSDIKAIEKYDLLVFFTPVGIKSLKQNFPNFKQGNTRIAAFGHTTAQTVKALNYRLDIFAPTVQNPSMSSALESYIKEANKR
jgi:uroporphyrinogen-III synthase